MTDIATALAATPGNLSSFDGLDVLRATIAVTGAGDGLSEAMKVDPQEFHHGEELYVVLKCEVAKVRFDPIKDTDALIRVHILKAGDATIVDKALVGPLVAEQAERIRLAKEAAAGVRRLEFADQDEETEEDVLHRQHEQGVHEDGTRDNCPDCEAELALEAQETGDELAVVRERRRVSDDEG
jgi:glucokinase